MSSVFVGGSRRLGRVSAALAHRLDNIMQKHLRVLIGDANGFDRAAQAYLAERGYRDVAVYCTAGKWRNNVGDWPVQAVEYGGRDRGRAFYTAKDDAMLRDGDYGLFAWDGKSAGTLRNIREMADRGKPSAVYVSSLKKFVTIRTAEDALTLSRGLGSDASATPDLFTATWTAGAENIPAS